jgi:hypothetical protein
MSCADHEKTTTKFEDRCAERLFGAARPHLKLYRNRNKRRTRLATPIIQDDATSTAFTTVPIEDHPGMLVNLQFQPAGYPLGMPHTEWNGASIVFTQILPNLGERISKTPRSKFNLARNIDTFNFVLAVSRRPPA